MHELDVQLMLNPVSQKSKCTKSDVGADGKPEPALVVGTGIQI